MVPILELKLLSAYLLLAFAATLAAQSTSGYRDWKAYGGGSDNIHYSSLNQINRENVRQLQVAWTYETHDEYRDSEMECNPIIVDGVLYATSPRLRVIALDAATGNLRWEFDSSQGKKVNGKRRNRGVTFWSDREDRRIFVVADTFLYALNATTGSPVESFGQGGRVDLREGLGRPPETLAVSATSPGIVYRDVIILGSSVSEDLPAAPGDIRAYDVRSGKVRWSFHTLPHPGEFGYESWPKDAWQYSGAANNWAGMSLDEKRGIVFAPTGSAAFDFYGANRIGDNLFANTLLALRADTGERIWHFQAVKHDAWDRDYPAPPSLVTVKRNGKSVDALAQITKSGHLFLFERASGKPLFPIEYRAVPASDVDGEKLSNMQPLPTQPIPFARQSFSEQDATNRTPEAHRAVVERLRQVRSGEQFTPPSLQGTVVFPGFDGGGEWGGGSFDPETGLFYVNSNEMPWILRLVAREIPNSASTARSAYRSYCASCHREDRTGSPPEFPSLAGIGAKYTKDEIAGIIRKGSGRMPAFSQFSATDVQSLVDYLVTGENRAVGPHTPSPMDLKYRHDGYNKFLDPDGYPAIEPPWGTLNAIDLNTGRFVWKIPFGEYPELAEKGMRNTGSENYGGSVVTAGGILFIGATDRDRKFHAYDKATGGLLWETTLPAAGNATPSVYEVNGREFVVIAAGGGKWGSPSGGTYVAFALPRE